MTDKMIFNVWDTNKDGAGIMCASPEGLHLLRPYYDVEEFIEAYRSMHAAYGAAYPIAVHFRFATHGKDVLENCHPHPLCNGAVGLMHNGILPFDPPSMCDDSDTAWFTKTVLAYRTAKTLLSKPFGELLANMIGSSNKLVLMDGVGNSLIVNEASGHWKDETWFSNHGYMKPTMCFGRSRLPAVYTKGEAWNGTDNGEREQWEEYFATCQHEYGDASRK